ncbi:MAG: 50S ribosomal protein L2 [Candidatus Thermoplasmatota archaeon]|nr:50S ribosomal protein L2 [Candidatus Thermoplasmatota archaeon]
MGKPLRTQRRGKGSSAYTSPSHRHRGGVTTPRANETKGVVKYLDDDPGRTAPIAIVEYDDGKKANVLAAEGMFEGQELEVGPDSPIATGNTLPLGKIPEGTQIHNIESKPGDGGKFVKAAGTSAMVVSQGEKTTVKLPSEKFMSLNPNCRAVIGIVAGAGRQDRPFAKAGKVFHARRSRAREHFRVRGIAMNPVNHPHGGGGHPHVGTASTVSAHTPPGRKVGRLSSKKKKGRK